MISSLVRAVWLLFTGLLLILAPTQIWLGEPVWQQDANGLLQAVGLAAAYVTGAVLLLRLESGRPRSRGVQAAAGTIPLAAFCLLLLLLEPSYSRGVLLVGLLLFGLLLAVPSWLPRRLDAATAAVGGTLVVFVILGGTGGPAVESGFRMSEGDLEGAGDTLVTHLQSFTAEYVADLGDPAWGGGLGRLGEDMLLVTGSGDFYRVFLAGGQFDIEPVALRAPLNRDDFIADTDTIVEVRSHRFRVAGLLVQPKGDSVRVVVSHHYWKATEACFVLRMSETTVVGERLGGGTGRSDHAPETWKTVYETRPCLRLKDQGDPFAGQQSGGRMAALGDTAIILTVGDHQFDGVNSSSLLPQRLDNDYGKTLIIPREGSARVYTLGHRNPQGLLVTSQDEIWLTEHGPRGGDELNLLHDGANYGWPLQTYGTQYEDFTWPLAQVPSPRAGFTEPRFVWVPSIGVSNLIEIEGDDVPGWQGDFLVAALGDESLYRLHREEGRLVYSERIEVGARLRDLAEASGGRLVLWVDDGRLAVLTPIDLKEARAGS